MQNPRVNYYIPDISPVQGWEPNIDLLANEFTQLDITTIVHGWLSNGTIRRVTIAERPDLLASNDGVNTVYFRDNLVPQQHGYVQATIPVGVIARLERRAVLPQYVQVRVLTHLIVWRYHWRAEIPRGLEISHCDHDHRVLRLVAETHSLNESRKACHQHGWTAANNLCPHRCYYECT